MSASQRAPRLNWSSTLVIAKMAKVQALSLFTMLFVSWDAIKVQIGIEPFPLKKR
jgi:hypothetical protein